MLMKKFTDRENSPIGKRLAKTEYALFLKLALLGRSSSLLPISILLSIK
ncbi:hypothetical protein ACE38V_13125 [Cytobacillus sp. Hz8]